MPNKFLQARLYSQSFDLTPDEAICFDSILFMSGIEYNPTNGQIQLDEGIYYFNVTISASMYLVMPTFSLCTSSGEIITGSTSQRTGMITFSGIVQALVPNTIVWLRNDNAQYNTTEFIANIVLFSFESSSAITDRPQPIYGTFIGFCEDEFRSSDAPAILPVQQSAAVSADTAFTVGANGSVIVNQAGVYEVSGQLQACHSTGNTIALQVNQQGISPAKDNAIIKDAANCILQNDHISTIFSLVAGDEISMALIVGNCLRLVSAEKYLGIEETQTTPQTPSVMITVKQIA